MKRLYYNIVLFCICCCWSPGSFAQTHMIDSLQNDLKKSKDDSVTVFLLSALANEYYAYDTLKSAVYLDRASVMIKKMNWDYATGDHYLVKGMLRQLSSENDLAHLFLDTAI